MPGARSTRDGDTGNEDNSSFARFFKLDKYVMFSFAMTSSLASDSDKFKIIITLRRAQKFGDTGPYKISIFCLTVYRRRFFLRKVFLPCSQMGTPAGLRLDLYPTNNCITISIPTTVDRSFIKKIFYIKGASIYDVLHLGG